ncbi:MAG: ribonuclease Z [Acidithiobacillales bacterium SG8_45]|jgi:ribonuclease Z|nr:MAG: ribonuclease Z [Acidithiobacillales bacterium SG8_45]
MKPLFHPELVNGPFEDPVVYIDFLFERRALMFDLGDIAALPPKKILRLSHIFVSHAHMDHFIGFDRILRICLGRERELNIYGPPGFIPQVGHRLAGYTWNLTESYDTDFTIHAHEIHDNGIMKRASFRCRNQFRCEPGRDITITDNLVVDEDLFSVEAMTLDHQTPCLAYTLIEKSHINIWKNRLDKLGLATGAWLKNLKSAIRRGDNADTPIEVRWQDSQAGKPSQVELGELQQDITSVSRGQKISYVVDCAWHDDNAKRIRSLVTDSDILFIESVFLDEDADRGKDTSHLTAGQAGRIARDAGVVRLVPIHFSPRYSDRPEALETEAMRAFRTTT